MRTKAGLPTTTIVIIAIVIMLIVAAVIYLALPAIEDAVNPDPCDDTCFEYHPGSITDRYVDCDHLSRYIIFWHDTNQWQYHDGHEGEMSLKFNTLHDLRVSIQAYYDGGGMSWESWHWFDCTAGAIS